MASSLSRCSTYAQLQGPELSPQFAVGDVAVGIGHAGPHVPSVFIVPVLREGLTEEVLQARQDNEDHCCKLQKSPQH
jgi:hypothetical protein